MRQLLPWAGLVFLIVASLAVSVTYLKFYNERTQNYYKHHYVLKYECQSGRQLSNIQYNQMTYDGTATNCTEALVFTSIPPTLGAIHDMWIASPFYALLHATDWKIQVAYTLFVVITLVTLIRSYFNYRAQQAVLNAFSGAQKGVMTARSAIDGRERMLVKVSPNDEKERMKQLAADLLNEEPVFTRLKHDTASSSSYSASAPYVVGTVTPSASE